MQDGVDSVGKLGDVVVVVAAGSGGQLLALVLRHQGFEPGPEILESNSNVSSNGHVFVVIDKCVILDICGPIKITHIKS